MKSMEPAAVRLLLRLDWLHCKPELTDQSAAARQPDEFAAAEEEDEFAASVVELCALHATQSTAQLEEEAPAEGVRAVGA